MHILRTQRYTKKIEPLLRSALIDLIVKEGVNEFLMGNNGKFDNMVRRILVGLSEAYPIKYSVVLAYLPSHPDEITDENTVYPEGLESFPRKFAIHYRNKWMLEQTEIVVCYVAYPSSGAGQFVEIAEKKGKRIINLNLKQNCRPNGRQFCFRLFYWD